ncbi:putative nucleotidyltransferase substrate binding domain-containing protein [Halarcobacter ebronensis]|uniref:Cyclic nucleotide-binding protein n=1 Tax=Halarcobacter ebronensis TaxID=1462615 RepID=A0A4Q1AJW9_9BACT|nr:putative nucleotidyltransferase substrate binding domain-containing protein [Halarcobacter ebronensis]QKF81194.1 cAMP-binding nucleotidyltransferase (CBS domain) [Halarcobacter ebronensis]RXK03231.1 cyclic nucleotide-binding protein [Halarcobacter ebronensis]
MSIHEQIAFIKEIPPFDNLTKSQLDFFAENLDIIYLKKDVILQQEGVEPKNLYFIIKGIVQEKQAEEVISIYSNSEIFDPISLIENRSKYSFVTAQETICYILPRAAFIKILHENPALESFFFQSISQKLNANMDNEKNKDLANMMVAKVKDANVHRAVIVPFETTIFEAVQIIKDERVPTLLLKDNKDEIHIVTDSDFREKVILNRMDFDDIVGKISNSGLKYVNENDFLFNAQLLMTKHRLKRLVVKNNKDEIVGIIDQISLSSFFATHTFSVSNEIDNAKNIEELKKASQSFNKIIKSLHAKGVKVDFISRLINQLNRKVMNKLFLMLAPKELIGKSALLVMGSEGRGEQILKTDQDNALLIDDSCECTQEQIEEFAKLYTETLVDFGFPRCEGNIMVSNPYWCRRLKDFKDLIYEWVMKPSGDNFMNLAIFYDAVCASGNRVLLDELKEYLFKIGSTSKTFYMHFAKIIMDFNVPLGFFDGFVFDSKDKEHKDEIDIKKGGIFIIVQSIRTLSLEHKLMRVNTLKRIQELEKKGEFDKEFASEITEAFNFLLTLKLKSNLEKLDSGKKIDNYINPENLTTMEKDLLKDSFKIVNKLKKKLEHHYKLNYV